VIGNLAIQALATGRIQSPAAVREVVRRSFRLRKHTPQRALDWERNRGLYQEIVERARSRKDASNG
jgi:hypothetical protein